MPRLVDMIYDWLFYIVIRKVLERLTWIPNTWRVTSCSKKAWNTVPIHDTSRHCIYSWEYSNEKNFLVYNNVRTFTLKKVLLHLEVFFSFNLCAKASNPVQLAGRSVARWHIFKPKIPIFPNRKSQFGQIWEGLAMEGVGLFYCHLAYFATLW
jgi:hypothetical protein